MMEKFLSFEKRYQIRENYKKATKRLLLLDYDGTLVNIAQKPMDAMPDRRVTDILDMLAEDENNIVALVSGRDRRTLDEWFGNPKLIYAAEHGALLKLAFDKEWSPIGDFNTNWKPEFKRTLDTFVRLHEGSFVEEKEYSLVWHYRLSPMRDEPRELARICNALQELDSASEVLIKQGKKILEVSCPSANKGLAAAALLNIYKPRFVLAAGDDTTDEDMFSVLNNETYNTIKVGLEDTKANYFVINPGLVLSFLEFLAG